MKFILEFACFQGRKLSRNRLCTVGLTITSGDVTGTGVGIVTALAFPLIMQCRYAMCFSGIFSPVNTEKTPRGSPVFCGFIIWSVLWLSHFVLFSMSRYFQPIRAIFDRDIMRVNGNYLERNDMSFISHVMLPAKFCIVISARCTGDLCEILSWNLSSLKTESSHGAGIVGAGDTAGDKRQPRVPPVTAGSVSWQLSVFGFRAPALVLNWI